MMQVEIRLISAFYSRICPHSWRPFFRKSPRIDTLFKSFRASFLNKGCMLPQSRGTVTLVYSYLSFGTVLTNAIQLIPMTFFVLWSTWSTLLECSCCGNNSFLWRIFALSFKGSGWPSVVTIVFPTSSSCCPWRAYK